MRLLTNRSYLRKIRIFVATLPPSFLLPYLTSIYIGPKSYVFLDLYLSCASHSFKLLLREKMSGKSKSISSKSKKVYLKKKEIRKDYIEKSDESEVVETDEETQQETSSPKPETSSPKPETSSPKPETSSPKPETSRPKPETSRPKPETSRPKPVKPTKAKKGVKEKAAGRTANLSAKNDAPAKRTMIQTNLSNTKEGIEVISSPEQPQLKPQKKKSEKKSRSTQPSEKQSIEKGKKQTRITNLFPVRKSNRKCKSEQEKDENAKITQAILSKNKAEGLEVRNIEDKGRGVFATRPFNKNEFVCEYAGERISYKEAKEREGAYAENEDIGCYMYYLEYNNNKYCIDATKENDTFGRLLNHSRSGNCKTKMHIIKNKPHLILVAHTDVEKGDELTYDYGDRSKAAIESHPWLQS